LSKGCVSNQQRKCAHCQKTFHVFPHELVLGASNSRKTTPFRGTVDEDRTRETSGQLRTGTHRPRCCVARSSRLLALRSCSRHRRQMLADRDRLSEPSVQPFSYSCNSHLASPRPGYVEAVEKTDRDSHLPTSSLRSSSICDRTSALIAAAGFLICHPPLRNGLEYDEVLAQHGPSLPYGRRATPSGRQTSSLLIGTTATRRHSLRVIR
jgi:hypothetical protein